MRTPIVILAGSLLTACVSGTRVVYVPVPADPAPAPAPAPARTPPVAVTIARVEESRLLVSTNQPAYLAVFEIVPGHGVTLAYPTSPRQRRAALAGSHWLTVSRWSDADERYDRVSRSDRQGYSERHLYVLASERPLRLTDDAFNDDYLRTVVVGSRAMRAASPYETIAALSRRFVPPEKDEDWGEDLFTIAVSRPTVVVHVAKIYCPDGSVMYVREEMADRVTCPYYGRRDVPASAPPPRPDSVVASNGRPMTVPPTGPRMQPPVFRVPRPSDENPVIEQQGMRRGSPPGHPADVDGGRIASSDSSRDERGRAGKDHEDNGNHYGWDRTSPHKPSKPEQKPEKPEQKPESKPEQKPNDDDNAKGKSEEKEKRERVQPADSDTTSISADSSDTKRRKRKPKSSEQSQ
jgi:hypothetical protein